jgi:hypothetical protein
VQTSKKTPSALFDLFRVLLIPLSLIVAAALVLVILPQSTVDRIIGEMHLRRGDSAREKIAFLYLGHRIQKNRFQIRGVIRNITTEPIEQLDANVRLYSPERDLLETAIVRMDKETIGPDELARFDLVYPDYGSNFSSYSVEFKLRQDGVLPYKDLRETREQPDRKPAGGMQQN